MVEWRLPYQRFKKLAPCSIAVCMLTRHASSLRVSGASLLPGVVSEIYLPLIFVSWHDVSYWMSVAQRRAHVGVDSSQATHTSDNEEWNNNSADDTSSDGEDARWRASTPNQRLQTLPVSISCIRMRCRSNRGVLVALQCVWGGTRSNGYELQGHSYDHAHMASNNLNVLLSDRANDVCMNFDLVCSNVCCYIWQR